jgi:hypothetical protein
MASFQNLFTQPFPPNGTIYPLTKSENAHYPVWTSGGKELFYIPGPTRFSRVDIATEPAFSYTNPVEVPKGGFFEAGPAYVRSYDVMFDGSRIAAIVGVAGAGVTGIAGTDGDTSGKVQIELVLNWSEELKRRVLVK